MNRPDKKPPWFELAAARTKSHFTGESELAATTERRVIEAVTRRKHKPKAFWLIPITLVGSGSLAWAEEVTLVSETHASDEAYAAAAAAFEPKDLVDLTLTIAAMNAFNRLGAPFRVPVKAKP